LLGLGPLNYFSKIVVPNMVCCPEFRVSFVEMIDRLGVVAVSEDCTFNINIIPVPSSININLVPCMTRGRTIRIEIVTIHHSGFDANS